MEGWKGLKIKRGPGRLQQKLCSLMRFLISDFDKKKSSNGYSFFLVSFFFIRPLSSKAFCNRYSICPFTLLNSSSAHFWRSFRVSALMRSTNAFLSLMLLFLVLIHKKFRSINCFYASLVLVMQGACVHHRIYFFVATQDNQ